MKKACDAIGRDISEIELGVFFGLVFDERSVAPLEDLGVKRVILPLPPAGAEDVLPKLDEYAKYIS